MSDSSSTVREKLSRGLARLLRHAQTHVVRKKVSAKAASSANNAIVGSASTEISGANAGSVLNES